MNIENKLKTPTGAINYGHTDFAPFRKAIQTGDLKAVKQMLNIDKNLANAECVSGYSVLMEAVEYGHPEIITELLSNGANIDHKDKDGKTALHHACEVFHSDLTPEKIEKTVQILVQAGANIDAKDKKGETPLHKAVHHPSVDTGKITETLLHSGADANATDDILETPLHEVVAHHRNIPNKADSTKVVNLLLEHGAQIDAHTSTKWGYFTPLHYAVGSNDTKAVDAMLKDVDGHYGMLDKMVDSYGGTPLHSAIRFNSKEMVEKFIKAGANVNLPLNDGTHPLDMVKENSEISNLLKNAGATKAPYKYEKERQEINRQSQDNRHLKGIKGVLKRAEIFEKAPEKHKKMALAIKAISKQRLTH